MCLRRNTSQHALRLPLSQHAHAWPCLQELWRCRCRLQDAEAASLWAGTAPWAGTPPWAGAGPAPAVAPQRRGRPAVGTAGSSRACRGLAAPVSAHCGSLRHQAGTSRSLPAPAPSLQPPGAAGGPSSLNNVLISAQKARGGRAEHERSMAFHPGRHPLTSFWPLSCVRKAELSPGDLESACEPLAPERTRPGRCGPVFCGALPFARSREVLEGSLPTLSGRRRSQLLHSNERERQSLAQISRRRSDGPCARPVAVAAGPQWCMGMVRSARLEPDLRSMKLRR